MKFRDLRKQYENLKNDINRSIDSVIRSTSFIQGKEVRELEEKLAEYIGRGRCVTCANGTDALQLSLMTLGLEKGDAFFTSDFTYFASAGAGSILGATPVFVDIDLDTFNMDPVALEKQILRVIAEGEYKPKVILPVDLFGQPADYDKIIPIAKKFGLKILEDGAQGFGGSIRGLKACSFGEISTTSFFPAKPLGCYGDGGAIFTDDNAVADRLESLRAQGKSPTDKYDNREIGLNSRLDTIQAAILMCKLKAFREYELEAVNKVAEHYTSLLEGYCKTPVIPSGFRSSWAQYTILLENDMQRNLVQRSLKEKEIPSMIYYPRGLHQQGAYSQFKLDDKEFLNTVDATRRCLSLPMHPYLKKNDIELVCDVVIEAMKGR